MPEFSVGGRKIVLADKRTTWPDENKKPFRVVELVNSLSFVIGETLSETDVRGLIDLDWKVVIRGESTQS